MTNPIRRTFQKLRSEGISGLLEAAKWKWIRHKNMVLVVRPAGAPPVRQIPRHRCKEALFRMANPDDLDALCVEFPKKRDLYRERLATKGMHCNLAEVEGVIIAFEWWSTEPYIDPEMKCEIIPDDQQVYRFEGWTRLDWRSKGVGAIGSYLMLEEYFPELGFTSSMALIESDNRPSLKLHKRLDFKPVGRRIHLRFGPLYWTSKILPLKKSVD
ncbi:MAG: hypothetical protein MK213_00160 [Planctomycetes bacterium]|nr:hypothetical protein [Planctomycetota bacterium]